MAMAWPAACGWQGGGPNTTSQQSHPQPPTTKQYITIMAGKQLTEEAEQLFVKMVGLCADEDCDTIEQLAINIRLLLQNTPTRIFKKLRCDTSLPTYKKKGGKRGKLYASLQSWKTRWVKEGVMEEKIRLYAEDIVNRIEAAAAAQASPDPPRRPSIISWCHRKE